MVHQDEELGLRSVAPSMVHVLRPTRAALASLSALTSLTSLSICLSGHITAGALPELTHLPLRRFAWAPEGWYGHGPDAAPRLDFSRLRLLALPAHVLAAIDLFMSLCATAGGQRAAQPRSLECLAVSGFLPACCAPQLRTQLDVVSLLVVNCPSLRCLALALDTESFALFQAPFPYAGVHRRTVRYDSDEELLASTEELFLSEGTTL